MQWVEAAATTLAGIVSLPGAFAANPIELADESDTSAPTLSTDGIDVEGYRTIDLGFVFDGAAETCDIRAWLYDGTRWYAPEAAKTVTAPTGLTNVYVEPIDVESFARLAIQVTATPATGVTIYAMPFRAAP